MDNLLGVMQGRLLPKYKGRYQAHPCGYWQDEFFKANSLGLDCIEFILDYEKSEENPLLRSGGTDEIQSVIKLTAVSVYSICADYFMDAPLHSANSVVVQSSHDVMSRLIINASELGVRDIVIPCVDRASLTRDNGLDRFVEVVSTLLPLAESCEVNLCLEADLAPDAFANLLTRCSSGRLTVNYDTGNSAALGYNATEELAAYGEFITDVHIKDRVLGGGSVVLGQGDVDFDAFFEALGKHEYVGPLIMQAYRDEEGLSIFKAQLEWLRNKLNFHGLHK